MIVLPRLPCQVLLMTIFEKIVDKKVFKLYSKSSNLIKCLPTFEDTAPTFVMPNSSVSKMFYEMILTDGRD